MHYLGKLIELPINSPFHGNPPQSTVLWNITLQLRPLSCVESHTYESRVKVN